MGLILAATLAGACGCTTKNDAPEDPKRRLTEYISRSFEVKGVEDRRLLSEYLTGNAKTRLEAWSEDQFRQAFIDSKRQFIKLAFREIKPASPTEVNITYELSYLDQNKGHDAKVTNKKLCQMVQDQGRWYIAEVTSIKELVEYRNEMSLP
jgi:hypothetical protein